MARPGMMQHRKFVRLVAVLGLPRAHVRGLLECLWDVAYQCGQEYLGDALDVELAAGWTGETGKLCQALADCGGNGDAGFIEAVTDSRHSPSQKASEDHDNGSKPGSGVTDVVTDVPIRYRVHDLFDHAPEYVAGRAQREDERRKVKHCERCKNRYHSSDQRSRFCCHACRTASWRDRRGDVVTDGDGALRHRDVVKRTETQCDGSPAPAPKYNYKKRPSEAPASDVVPELNLTPQEDSSPRISEGRLGKKHRGHPSPNPEVKRLLDTAVAACKEFRGFQPLIRGAPEAQAMALLLKGRTFAEAESLVREFYRDPPDWNLDQGCLGLEHIPAAATKILARGSTTPGSGSQQEDELAAERRRKIMQTEKREYGSDPLWPGYEAAVAASAAPVGFITYAETHQERP